MWESRNICEQVRRDWLRRMCYEAYMKQNSFLMVVEGPLGAGKSTFALKIAYDIYRDWDRVLDSIFFTPVELVERIEYNIAARTRDVIIILDDWGVWMELIKRYPYDPFSVSLLGHFETMRTWAGIVIMTMTTDKHMPRALRDNGYIYRYKAKVWKVHSDARGEMSRVRIYQRKQRMDEKWYWDTSTMIETSLWLFKPDHEVYSKYAEIRKRYVEFYNQVMEQAKKYSKMSVVLKTMATKWHK